MVETDSLRLDIWLDVACLFKTRSQAQNACKKGRVIVNGHHGKPHRQVHVGDTIEISIPGGGRKIVAILELQAQHVAKAKARELYDDLTPAPTPEEMEFRRLQRLSMPKPRPRGAGAPKKRERRQLVRAKEEWS